MRTELIVENKAHSLVNRLSELLQFISHTGEQGRLAELVISEWLRVTLPQKYSIGTGFIASVENGNLDLSSQQDIIIYDHQHCSPILKTAVGGIFPIESVYANFEVKKTLRKGSIKDGRPTELYKAFSDIAKIRRMAARKTYLKLVEGQSIATFEMIPSRLLKNCAADSSKRI
jgi:Domain of unknown function (DUF6602)